jgi:hypothetical protein
VKRNTDWLSGATHSIIGKIKNALRKLLLLYPEKKIKVETPHD